MSRVSDSLERFRGRSGSQFRLVSSVSPSAATGQVEAVWQARQLPDDVAGLWSASRSARLFEDADYGQWGLVLLDPQASRQRRGTRRNFSTPTLMPAGTNIGSVGVSSSPPLGHSELGFPQ